MKKFVKIFTLSIVFTLLFIILTAGFYLGINLYHYSNLKLDIDALQTTSTSISIYDIQGNIIDEDNSLQSNKITLKELPPYTYQAFISIEDKDFYKHKGISPKRIVAASFHNLKNMAFSQGASTISQQLIKNTHLSSQKTIDRKIREIVLTHKLEAVFSKEEILECYLNVIYFGNNCYGIKSASKYYFSKECKDLNLSESAILAGMIKAPKKYLPTTNPDNCINRRNLVLKEMLNDKKITEEDYLKAVQTPLQLKISNTNSNLNTYSEMALDEAQKVLHLPAKQIALSGYRIHTYMNKAKQEKLINSLSTTFDKNDYAGIIVDSKNHGVNAFYGKSIYKILDSKRQPGSCIKPILVYAPALNEDIISPETQILDEKIKISEYSPENIGGKYNGYISVKESISKSINIPAVKTLSYVGIPKAKSYAEKMGIEFDKNDTSYALALGGMTYGTTLKQLTDAYSTFNNDGKFTESRFINFITNKNGKVVYMHEPKEKQVLRRDTCYLMTDMLMYTAKNGTAKKLKDIKTEIASKTGTVGKPNSKQNLDAWNISYTPSSVCGIWTGNLDNCPINIAGGNQPTEVVRKIFDEENKEEFERPNEIVEREIDTIDLEDNHRITLASPQAPARFKQTCLFSIFNLPEQSQNFTNSPSPEVKTKTHDKQNHIIISAKKHFVYEIYDENSKLIEKISEIDGEKDIIVNTDKLTIKTKYVGAKSYSEKEIKFG